MGVYQSRIVNQTGVPVFIVTYNYSDTVYWTYREARQVPDDAQPISVDGLAGGYAVKVAVIYNRFVDGSRFVCDLFSVNDQGTLTIQGMTQGAGVTKWDGDAQLRIKGMVISLSNDVAETVKTVLAKLVDAAAALIPVPLPAVGEAVEKLT